MKMIPMKKTFHVYEADCFRLMIVIKDGKVIGVKGLYDSGFTDEHKKSGWSYLLYFMIVYVSDMIAEPRMSKKHHVYLIKILITIYSK